MWELGRGRRLRGADAVDAAVAVGVETQFMLDNVDAPAMYPHVNTLLGPLRKASAASGDSTHVAAGAGSGFPARSGGERGCDHAESLPPIWLKTIKNGRWNVGLCTYSLLTPLRRTDRYYGCPGTQ